MTGEHIIGLLQFCLKTTYFQFKGRLFGQLYEAAMGSPINPIVTTLYMEDLKINAIKSAEYPQRVWKRCVEDTLVVFRSAGREKFLEDINSIDPYIQSVVEDTRADGSI